MNHKSQRRVLFSGIQPSGNLMIGNYIGAVRHWVRLQETFDCLFALVDLHAVTVRQNPSELLERSYDFLALYIACGIDPDKQTVFVQSHVPAHAQLAWILNCLATMGELGRMTQFKEKAKTHEINAGLFAYPVLMAADILLYGTEIVPVGEDQKQHLELTRDLARRFNSRYGGIFTMPEPYIPETGARIMGLQNPAAKMSKSDADAGNYIALTDGPDVIRKKIRRAVTDPGRDIVLDPSKPGISNLLTIWSNLTDEPVAGIEERYRGKGYARFKQDLAEVLIEFLKPVRDRYALLIKDRTELHDILSAGARDARDRSEEMLDRVHRAVGFIPRLGS